MFGNLIISQYGSVKGRGNIVILTGGKDDKLHLLMTFQTPSKRFCLLNKKPMLQIINISDEIPETIELDDYLPIIVRWGNQDLNLFSRPRLYWSILGEYELFEIGMDANTQVITVMKIVNIGKNTVKYNSNLGISPTIASSYGVPIFNIADWSSSPNFFNENYFREQGSFEIHVNNNHIYIIFSFQDVISQIVSGRIRFGLNTNNYLCALQIDNLSPEEMVGFLGTLKFMESSIGQCLCCSRYSYCWWYWLWNWLRNHWYNL